MLHASRSLAMPVSGTVTASAALCPGDVAAEDDVLVAACDWHHYRAIRAVAPILSRAAQSWRARAEERHGRRVGDATEVSDAGVRADQQAGCLDQMGQLQQIETPA